MAENDQISNYHIYVAGHKKRRSICSPLVTYLSPFSYFTVKLLTIDKVRNAIVNIGKAAVLPGYSGTALMIWPKYGRKVWPLPVPPVRVC